MTREAFELHRDRFLGADEIALRFRHATKLLRGSASDRAEGIALAEETLVYDPYDVPVHRALAAAKACDGDAAADAVYEHLAICHDVGAIEVAELRADRTACGAMSDATFEAVLASVVANAKHRTRFRDVAFDEIGPNTTAYETRLIWKPAHHGAVVAAHERLIAAATRAYEAAGLEMTLGPSVEAFDLQREKLRSPFILDEHLIGLQCHFGSVHRFVREVAPYVEDVRFLMFDQVSPVDELWIIDGVALVCRHPLHGSGLRERAELFEALCGVQRIRADAHLREYVTMNWERVAHVELEACEKKRSHADLTGDEAQVAIDHLVALGATPAFQQARLALIRNDASAGAAHLEDTIRACPDHREAFIMLARCRLAEDRFDEVVSLAERAVELNPKFCDDAHLVRGIALESLGRVDEARRAYRAYGTLLASSPASVAREAGALVERGFFASARIVFEWIVTAKHGAGIAADLGLARCAEALGENASARAHYERVLARSDEARAQHAWLAADLEPLEAAARAALGR